MEKGKFLVERNYFSEVRPMLQMESEGGKHKMKIQKTL